MRRGIQQLPQQQLQAFPVFFIVELEDFFFTVFFTNTTPSEENTPRLLLYQIFKQGEGRSKRWR